MDTDKVLDAANRLGEKMQELATAYGPQVADLAMTTARISAMQVIATGLICLIVAICVGRMSFIKGRAAVAAFDKPGYSEVPLTLLSAVCGVVALITAIEAFADLTRVSAWIGMFRPEVWIAARLLKL